VIAAIPGLKLSVKKQKMKVLLVKMLGKLLPNITMNKCTIIPRCFVISAQSVN
jgi:hypothetical protein